MEQPEQEDLSRKRNKSVRKPKRSKSAYGHFKKEISKKLLYENPSFRQVQIDKRVAEAWNELTTPQKEVYFKMSTKDKERYETELENYYKNQDEIKEQKKQRINEKQN
ncbi:high mobility group protein [Anaeramoeba flamelloides]|uniref:High mobility group protein n=1 Tax=Anaeramoeba flamelloides TaxID=1746091 RepID=A0AAV7ZS12_9EUKA|nr:high mobility group protein [Anaeramoeba flamelloides]KAJ6238070.1 high mobility group protein [Anaeramoeba flamelloides]